MTLKHPKLHEENDSHVTQRQRSKLNLLNGVETGTFEKIFEFMVPHNQIKVTM